MTGASGLARRRLEQVARAARPTSSSRMSLTACAGSDSGRWSDWQSASGASIDRLDDPRQPGRRGRHHLARHRLRQDRRAQPLRDHRGQRAGGFDLRHDARHDARCRRRRRPPSCGRRCRAAAGTAPSSAIIVAAARSRAAASMASPDRRGRAARAAAAGRRGRGPPSCRRRARPGPCARS